MRIPPQIRQAWLSPRRLEEFAQAAHRAGAPLTNCWGFVAQFVVLGSSNVLFSTVTIVFMPSSFNPLQHQNGLVANLYGPVGPVEGCRRHDSGML